MEDRVGQQLGSYRLLRLLGQGAFADVYLGEHIHLRTQAAIKVLQLRLVESNIQSFLNEARTIAHLVHPYIIRVLDFGAQDNVPFLVMDYAPKGTFRQRFLKGKPLPPTPLFPYIKQAALALQYAHDKKLVHRDVKPENMLLGSNEEVLLSDFGFALIAQNSFSRSPTEAAGTAAYMAPEQLQGMPRPASDQYSLGVVAYEWLTGHCPFQGSFLEIASQHMLSAPQPLREQLPAISTELEHVVMTALAKDPQQRFPSVREFASALERACLSAKMFSTDLSLAPQLFDSSSSSAFLKAITQTSLPAATKKVPQSEAPLPPFNRDASTGSARTSSVQRPFSSLSQPPFAPPGSQSPSSSPATPDKLSPATRHFSQSGMGPLSAEQLACSNSQTFQELQRSQNGPALTQSLSSPPLRRSRITPPARPQEGMPGAQPHFPQPNLQTGRLQPQGPTGSLPSMTQPHAAYQDRQPFASDQFSQPNLAALPPQQLPEHNSQVGQRFSQSGMPPLSTLQFSQSDLRPLSAETMGQRSMPLPYTSQSDVRPLSMEQFSQPDPQAFVAQQHSSQRGLAPQQPLQQVPPSRPFPIQQMGQMPPMHYAQQPPSLSIQPLPVNFASPAPQRVETASQPPAENISAMLKRSRRNISIGVLIFLLAMIVFIIIGSSGLFLLANNQHIAEVNNQQAALARQHSKATATAAAQGTIAATGATATAQANANPYDPKIGLLAMNDPLSAANQSGWQETNDPVTGKVCQFNAGSYHAVAPSNAVTTCFATSSDYVNFAYEIQMTFVKIGQKFSGGGITFRGNTAGQYYYFEIYESGRYSLALCNASVCPVQLLAGTGKSDERPLAALKGPSQANTVAVVASVSNFTIYVNGQLVAGPVTSTALAHGMIGVFVQGGREVGPGATADIAFSNVRVWKW